MSLRSPRGLICAASLGLLAGYGGGVADAPPSTTTALVRYDPATSEFESFPQRKPGNMWQINGWPGVVWAAESATDRIVLIRMFPPE